MNPSTTQLRAFSQCLLKLPDPTTTTTPEAWLFNAVSALPSLVPFDSAWWGQIEANSRQGNAKNLMHGSIGLSPQFAEEWNAISQNDNFAQASMDQLGKAICYNHSIDYEKSEAHIVNEFARRHRLYHCLAVTLQFQSSGLLFFISIYRDNTRPGFTPLDALWLEEYGTHLLSGWIRCLRQANYGRFRDHWDSAALTTSTGRILYIGKQLSRVLGERFKDWQGTFLPSLLVDALPASQQPRHRRDRTGLRVQPCGKFTSLMLTQHEDGLPPPRELSAALLYAQGQSYKEVARSLGVTPATVRTYLRQVYAQLGVSNKVALANALQNAGYKVESDVTPNDSPPGLGAAVS